MKNTPFKILSLDGGGIKGAYTAAILDRLEKQLDRPLANYFDMIVGTSTGAILAFGLAFGIPAKMLLEFYQTKGRQIFPDANWVETWFTTKYDTRGLKAALASVFGEKLLGDIERHVVVPTFNATNGNSTLFKTKHLKPANSYLDRKIVEVLLAATAAPTYFEAEDLAEGLHLDGGIWANCPALVGAVEATSRLNRQPATISMLSIGTTTSPFYITEKTAKGGEIKWLKPHIDLFMYASKTGTLHLAEMLVGNFHRIDTVVTPDRFKLDEVGGVKDLVSIGMSAANECIEAVETEFLKTLSHHPEIPFVSKLPLE